jgi:hypothetical protein
MLRFIAHPVVSEHFEEELSHNDCKMDRSSFESHSKIISVFPHYFSSMWLFMSHVHVTIRCCAVLSGTVSRFLCDYIL